MPQSHPHDACTHNPSRQRWPEAQSPSLVQLGKQRESHVGPGPPMQMHAAQSSTQVPALPSSSRHGPARGSHGRIAW